MALLLLLFIYVYLFIWLHRGSAVARGLGRSEVCGILVPRPGTELASPELQGGFLTTGPPGRSLAYLSGKDGKEHICQTRDPRLRIRGCLSAAATAPHLAQELQFGATPW